MKGANDAVYVIYKDDKDVIHEVEYQFHVYGEEEARRKANEFVQNLRKN